MGWKIFVTFIKDAGNLEINDDLIKSLGFKDFAIDILSFR